MEKRWIRKDRVAKEDVEMGRIRKGWGLSWEELAIGWE